MFKTIFSKFPGLHSEMIAESFSRYIKEFRKPCGKKRSETFQKNNKKLQYSQIQSENGQSEMLSKINKLLKQTGGISKVRDLQRMPSRDNIFKQHDELKQYKEQLDLLNDKANTMFEHMKQINKLVNKKIMDIEGAVTRSETIFVEEINTLIKNKQDITKFERKNYVHKQVWVRFIFKSTENKFYLWINNPATQWLTKNLNLRTLPALVHRKSTTRASLSNIFCLHLLKRRKDVWCPTRKDPLAVKTVSYKSSNQERSKTTREVENLPSKAWKLVSIDFINLKSLEHHQLQPWTVAKIWKSTSVWMLVARRSKRLVLTDTNLSPFLKKWAL